MSCCSEKEICKTDVEKNMCVACNEQAKKVEYKTVLMMLKYAKLKNAIEAEYYFCSNPNCDVVYFSNESEKNYKKQDLRIRVGIKETSESKHVCYCFDITEKQIIEEIKLTGKSTIPNFITKKIKEKLCACNIKNPSGKCCLGDVKKVVSQNGAKY